MKTITFTLFLHAALIITGFTSVVTPVMASTASKVKAAIVFKLTRYVQWSEEIQADKQLNLCVFGDNDLYSELKTTEGKTSKGMAISVEQGNTLADSSKTCDLLFIGNAANINTRTVTKVLSDKSVLSVSDRSGFAKEGGMVQIKERGGRIRFTVNLKSVRASGLNISSQLLGLAKVIK